MIFFFLASRSICESKFHSAVGTMDDDTGITVDAFMVFSRSLVKERPLSKELTCIQSNGMRTETTKKKRRKTHTQALKQREANSVAGNTVGYEGLSELTNWIDGSAEAVLCVCGAVAKLISSKQAPFLILWRRSVSYIKKQRFREVESNTLFKRFKVLMAKSCGFGASQPSWASQLTKSTSPGPRSTFMNL